MNMNFPGIPQRASIPSQVQLEALMFFLKDHPRLAAGAPTVPSWRDRTRRLWEKQSEYLNSLGGSVKSGRQWRKYWADKKSAVKKKAAQRDAMQGKISAEMDDFIQLTDTEERILKVIDGVYIPEGKLITRDTCENVPPASPINLHQSDVPPLSPQTVEIKIEPETFEFETIEEQTDTAMEVPMVLSSQVQNEIEHVNVPMLSEPTSTYSIPDQQACNHTVFQPSPSHDAPRLIRKPRRRRTQTATTQQPTQRRSQFVTLAERFLRVEESRLELDRRYATIVEKLLQRDLERDQTISQAMNSLADSLKLIAESFPK